MKTVGYLTDETRLPSVEEDAAWRWLAGQTAWHSEKLSFSRLGASLGRFDAIWLHDDSSLLTPATWSEESVRSVLREYVDGGGGLLLSLLGAQAVVSLGLESNPPNVIRKAPWDEQCWADDYPDIRGFSGFLGHPIFGGLRGAVYTWKPDPGVPFAGAFYEAPSNPLEGRVVAVERQYIKLNDERRLIWEYEVGSGMVLAIGSFLFFSHQGDRFRLHREMFAANCLSYLGERSQSPRTYWEFGEREVRESRHSSAPVPTATASLPTVHTGLVIEREPGEVRDTVFDVGGRRVLLMGREQTGIEEVWCHPVRIVRGIRLGIRSGQDAVRWLSDVAPRVTVRPESVSRVYDLGAVHIEETTFASHKDPAAAIHLDLHATHPFELVTLCTVDLRLMWPFPEYATGSLLHGWDEGLRAFVVNTANERLWSIIGSSRAPEEVLAGRFSGISVTDSGLKGAPSDRIELALAMRFACRQGAEEISLIIAGSDQGAAEAVSAYRHAVKHPGSMLLHQVEHYRRLFANSTAVRTPDDHFNEGLCWALAALDRFVVETPDLGTSLMAGFGTTNRGWDGNQAVSGRPGYAWYFGRDAVWSAFALLGAGEFESVRAVLQFLGRHQDISGKILHELTTSGHAHYDAADATPLYCILMGRYLRSTGDAAFARQEFPRLVRAMEFCLGTDTDGDGLIENTNVGHGWLEGGALFPVHTELYLASCWAGALEQAASVAEAATDRDHARTWSGLAERVRSSVRHDFWNEISACYSYAKMKDGSYRSERTILPAVAVYFGCVDQERMGPSMRLYSSSEFSTDWGARIIGRSDPAFNAAGYHSGSVWPLFTGWISLAEFALLRPLQGFDHLARNVALYAPLAAGYSEEVLNGERFGPSGVCSHQAWSESMALQPAFEGLAGVQADGRAMKLSLRPYVPAHWGFLRIDRVRVGEERVDIHLERKSGRMNFSLRTKAKSPIAVTIQILLPLGSLLRSGTIGQRTTRLKGMVCSYADSPVLSGTLRGSLKGSIQYSEGVALAPLVLLPRVGSPSQSVRCLEERIVGGAYELELEAPDGEGHTVVLLDPASRIISISGASRWHRAQDRVNIALDASGPLSVSGYRRSIVRAELADTSPSRE